MPFPEPNFELEQYPTPVELVRIYYDNVEAGSTVADLGAGTGNLSLPISSKVANIVAVEKDNDVVCLLRNRLYVNHVHNVYVVNSSLEELHGQNLVVDTVVSNPPFGTVVYGSSLAFLLFAMSIARRKIIMMSKTSYRSCLESFAIKNGWTVNVIYQGPIKLQKSMKQHAWETYDVDIDIIIYSRKRKLEDEDLLKKVMKIAAQKWRVYQESRSHCSLDFYDQHIEEPVGEHDFYKFYGVNLKEPLVDWFNYIRKTFKYRGDKLALLEQTYKRTVIYDQYGKIDVASTEEMKKVVQELLEQQVDKPRYHWIGCTNSKELNTGIFLAYHNSVRNVDGINEKFIGKGSNEYNRYCQIKAQGFQFLADHTLQDEKLLRILSPYTLQDVVEIVGDNDYTTIFAELRKVGVDLHDTKCVKKTRFCCKEDKQNFYNMGVYFLWLYFQLRYYVENIKGFTFVLTPDNVDLLRGIVDFDSDYISKNMTEKERLIAMQPIIETFQSIWAQVGMPIVGAFNLPDSALEIMDRALTEQVTYVQFKQAFTYKEIVVQLDEYEGGYYKKWKREWLRLNLDLTRDIVRSIAKSIIMEVTYQNNFRYVDCICDDNVDPEFLKLVNVVNKLLVVGKVVKRFSFQKYKEIFYVDQRAGFEVPRGLWDVGLKIRGEEYQQFQKILFVIASNERYDSGGDMYCYGFSWGDVKCVSTQFGPSMVPNYQYIPIVGKIPVASLDTCGHKECLELPPLQREILFFTLASTIFMAADRFARETEERRQNNYKNLARVNQGVFKNAPSRGRVSVDYKFIEYLYEKGQGITYGDTPIRKPVSFMWDCKQQYFLPNEDGLIEDLRLYGVPQGGSNSDTDFIFSMCLTRAMMERNMEIASKRGFPKPVFRAVEKQKKVKNKSAGMPLFQFGMDSYSISKLTNQSAKQLLIHRTKKHTPFVTKASPKFGLSHKTRVRAILGSNPFDTDLGRCFYPALRESLMGGDNFKVGIGLLRGGWSNQFRSHFSFRMEEDFEGKNLFTSSHDAEKWDKQVDNKYQLAVYYLVSRLIKLVDLEEPTAFDECYERDYEIHGGQMTKDEYSLAMIGNLMCSLFANFTYPYVFSLGQIQQKPGFVMSGTPLTLCGNGYLHESFINATWLKWLVTYNAKDCLILETLREEFMDCKLKPFGMWHGDTRSLIESMEQVKNDVSQRDSILSDDFYRSGYVDHTYDNARFKKSFFLISSFYMTPDKMSYINGRVPPCEFCSQATVVSDEDVFMGCPEPTRIMSAVCMRDASEGGLWQPELTKIRCSALAVLALPLRFKPGLQDEERFLSELIIGYVQKNYGGLDITQAFMNVQGVQAIPYGMEDMYQCVDSCTNKMLDINWMWSLYKPNNVQNLTNVRVPTDIVQKYEKSLEAKVISVKLCDYQCGGIALYACQRCEVELQFCGKHARKHLAENPEHYVYTSGMRSISCIVCDEVDITKMYTSSTGYRCDKHKDGGLPVTLPDRFIGDTETGMLVNQKQVDDMQDHIDNIAKYGVINDRTRFTHYKTARININLHTRLTIFNVDKELKKRIGLQPVVVKSVQEESGRVYAELTGEIDRNATYTLRRGNIRLGSCTLKFLASRWLLIFKGAYTMPTINDLLIQQDLSAPLARALDSLTILTSQVLLYELVCGYRRPVDNALSLVGLQLNDSQACAVESCMRHNFTIVRGPPGTGKTKTAVQMIKKYIENGFRVMVASQSHKATDNVMNRLVTVVESKLCARNIPTDNPQRVHTFAQEYTGQPGVMCLATTLTTNIPLSFNRVDLLVIDEYSKLEDCYLYTLMLTVRPKQVVFFGDDKQLPPIVSYRPMLANLVNYLATMNPKVLFQLDVQYRMCQEISDYISRRFYDGTVRCGLPIRDNYLGEKHIIHVKIVGKVVMEKTMHSFYSPEENEAIRQIADELNQYFPGRSKAIITNYSPAQSILEDQVKGFDIVTVDSSQGDEWDIVIIAVTKQQNFTLNMNRVNVSCSRARDYLFIFCIEELKDPYPKEAVVMSVGQSLIYIRDNAYTYLQNQTKVLEANVSIRYDALQISGIVDDLISTNSSYLTNMEYMQDALMTDTVAIDFEAYQGKFATILGDRVRIENYPVSVGFVIGNSKTVRRMYCQPTIYDTPTHVKTLQKTEYIPKTFTGASVDIELRLRKKVYDSQQSQQTMLDLLVVELQRKVMEKVVFVVYSYRMEFIALWPVLKFIGNDQKCIYCKVAAPFYHDDIGPLCGKCSSGRKVKILNPLFLDLSTYTQGSLSDNVGGFKSHDAGNDAMETMNIYQRIREHMQPNYRRPYIPGRSTGYRVYIYRCIQDLIMKYVVQQYNSVIDIGVGHCSQKYTLRPKRFVGIDTEFQGTFYHPYDELYIGKYENMTETFDCFVANHSLYGVNNLREQEGFATVHLKEYADEEGRFKYSSSVSDRRYHTIGNRYVYCSELYTLDEYRLKFSDYDITELQIIPHTCVDTEFHLFVDTNVQPVYNCITAMATGGGYVMCGYDQCVKQQEIQNLWHEYNDVMPVSILYFKRKEHVPFNLETIYFDTTLYRPDIEVDLTNVHLPGYETRNKYPVALFTELKLDRCATKIITIINALLQFGKIPKIGKYLILGATNPKGTTPMYEAMRKYLPGKYILIDPYAMTNKLHDGDEFVRARYEDTGILDKFDIVVSDVWAANDAFWDMLFRLSEMQRQDSIMVIKITSTFNHFSILTKMTGLYRYFRLGRLPVSGFSTEAFLLYVGRCEKHSNFIDVKERYRGYIGALMVKDDLDVRLITKKEEKKMRELLERVQA